MYTSIDRKDAKDESRTATFHAVVISKHLAVGLATSAGSAARVCLAKVLRQPAIAPSMAFRAL